LGATGPTVSRIKIAFRAVTIPITNQATPMLGELLGHRRSQLLQEATASPGAEPTGYCGRSRTADT
ncbi:MAG TPA: hypothetical protein VN609_07830, partial [Propionibacteriaceae bacterium]|nr:hypothetical protein [Propionibacteriaceae bacterium]